MKNQLLENFGMYLCNNKVLKERLSQPIYQHWQNSLAQKGSLDIKTADAIAFAMKTWAIELGATHYSHWFQPMTGKTAEKHDAFLEPDEYGQPIVHFSGKSLIKGETDGSSFPNGGLRATFEARGYTYWDITSPAFIRGHVLCIPSIFISYNGESLDKKAPLLKSMDALNIQSLRLLHLLNEHDVQRITPVLGQEQEYFLVDELLYKNRLDLHLTGRTLFGQNPPKGQESEEHYFGSISAKVADYMRAVNDECWKLGIYSRVEHNEVAYGQFEIVPVFAQTHISIDQNQLIMDILKKTAPQFGLACVLHEKPFAHINGSGKHNNWSLLTDTGINLLEPSNYPEDNLRFLLVVCGLMKAIDTYPELLRMAASGPGNDHRLGANEAPPAIISMYVGQMLEKLLFEIEEGKIKTIHNKENLHSPLSSLKALPKEFSDRNRTSPFAFTGNKFEFRMVGSSLSAASANIVLNTALAESFEWICEQLENDKNHDLKTSGLLICQKIISQHKRILFSGDGYSSAWIVEAKHRGLPNISSFTESIDSLIDSKAVQLFTKFQVFSERELEARAEILHEQFVKAIQFEAKTMIHMVRKQFLPSSIKELSSYQQCQELEYKSSFIDKMKYDLCMKIDSIDAKCTLLEQLVSEVDSMENLRERGLFMQQMIRPQMEVLRQSVDQLETVMSKENYPIPTYSDIFYSLD